MLFAAGTSETALAFVEIGALVFALALLSRLAGRFGLTAIPLYLLAGLAMGEGGFVQLDVTLEFFEIGGGHTTIPLHRDILHDPDFLAGRLSTRFMERFQRPSRGHAG